MSTRRQLLPLLIQFLFSSTIGGGIWLLVVEYGLFMPLFDNNRDTLTNADSSRIFCGIGGEPPFDTPPECVFYERESFSGDLPSWLQGEKQFFQNEEPFFLSYEFERELFWEPIDFGELGNFRDLQLRRKPLMPPLFNEAGISDSWIEQPNRNQLSILTPLGRLSTSSFSFPEEGSIVLSEPLEALNRFFDSLKIGVERPRVQLEDFAGSSSQSQLGAQLDQDLHLEDSNLYVERTENIGVGQSVSKEGLKVTDNNKFADLPTDIQQKPDVGEAKFDFESALMPDVGDQSNNIDFQVVDEQGNDNVDDLEITTPDSDSQQLSPNTSLEIDLEDGDVVSLFPDLINDGEQWIIRDQNDNPAHVPEKQSWLALALLAGYFMRRRNKP